MCILMANARDAGRVARPLWLGRCVSIEVKGWLFRLSGCWAAPRTTYRDSSRLCMSL